LFNAKLIKFEKIIILSLSFMSISFPAKKKKCCFLQKNSSAGRGKLSCLKILREEEAIAETVVSVKDGNYSFSLKLD
jgi:hypothetical protein